MLDLHTGKGYREVLPPVLVNSASLTGSGQLPKFADDCFRCAEDDLWLTPTAEVPVTSLHRDEIIPADQLPLRYVAYSPCFRREAGSYGRDTRGLIRLHQFNKVELYWFAHPDHPQRPTLRSPPMPRRCCRPLSCPTACSISAPPIIGFSANPHLRPRGVACRVPVAYREISSCSVCGDFQARRSSIRTKEGKATKLVHTLNGSGLAVGRTMAALLENGQQPDGSVEAAQSAGALRRLRATPARMTRLRDRKLMNVLASLLALALLIVIHEAGHFLAARLQGIRVNGFSIGFGPALIKRERDGVTYALRAVAPGRFRLLPR